MSAHNALFAVNTGLFTLLFQTGNQLKLMKKSVVKKEYEKNFN